MNEYGDNDRAAGTVPRLPTPYEREQHRLTCREFWRGWTLVVVVAAIVAWTLLLLGEL
jgi:hypothetical protein